MDSQPRKRFRENETCRSEGNIDFLPTANEDEQFTQSIPSLVSNIFLTNLRDVRLLKICRSVCRSWNIPASDSLKICSTVHLKEGESRLSEFRDLLLRRSFGVWQQLPSPFQNFNIEGLTFTDPIFLNLVLLPNISIASFQINMVTENQCLDHTNLNLFLAANKSNIRELKIIVNRDFELSEALPSQVEIRLTALKSFTFQDNCNDCTHIPFVKNLVSLCKPERIDLTVDDGNLLISLLSQDQATNLKSLTIIFHSNSKKAWKHLGNLKFSRIHSLELSGNFHDNELDQWRSFCKNVSPFVENLIISSTLHTDSKLRFPNLKSISLPSFNVLSHFSPDRFPSLENLTYCVPAQIISAPVTGFVPHVGVHSVNIDVIFQNVGQSSFYQGLMTLLTYISRQFPKVCSLGLNISKFGCTTFTDIWERFPNLKEIKLDGECDFLTFSGMELSMVNRYLQKGWPVQEIPRRKSIMDFTELKTIYFGPKFVLGPDMITHCLPRVLKLKEIRLHWNESLSVSILRDSVGHLEKIVFLNASESKFKAVMDQVLNVFPNAYLQLKAVTRW